MVLGVGRAFAVVITLVAGAVAILFLVKSYSGGSSPLNGIVNPGPAALAGAPAQDLPLKRLDGTPDSLANYRGKIVFMNLWATWCPPCRHEMPALERFSREYQSRGVIVLGVDQGESARVAGTFARSLHISYPILLDENEAYGRAYAAVGLPTTIIISRAGRILRGIDGEMTLPQMRAAVAPALAGK